MKRKERKWSDIMRGKCVCGAGERYKCGKRESCRILRPVKSMALCQWVLDILSLFLRRNEAHSYFATQGNITPILHLYCEFQLVYISAKNTQIFVFEFPNELYVFTSKSIRYLHEHCESDCKLSDLYQEGAIFDSLSRYLLLWMSSYLFFLSASKQILG
jgi:hypothetical protein